MLGRRVAGIIRFTARIIPATIATSLGLFVIGPWINSQLVNEYQANTVLSNDPSEMFPSGVQMVAGDIPSKRGQNIRILTWTKDNITFWPAGRHAFSKCTLPDGKTCENVVDRSEYNDTEAVLLHGQVIDPNDLPKYRFPDHKWLFYEIETPPQTWIQKEPLDRIRSVFNLTTTITLDSHIPMIERHRTCHINDNKLKEFESVNYAQGKTRKVAWFVSHCETQSKRELYAEELGKYIPIDVWGKCGNFTCGSKTSRGDCDKTVLDKDYKFYLSFENSICEEYVTEKLWRLLLQPISALPIVMGSIDYKKHIPNTTFLDVKDFKSPKDLADFLWKMDKDDALFNKYISRKNAVYCKHPGDKWFSEVRHECQICKYLHDHRDERTTVQNVVDFWALDRRCTDAKTYFQGSFDSDKL